MTGRDLITASLRLIGAIAPGESIAAQEATDGLASINRMIDSWSNEGLMIFETVREVFPINSGDQDYTMGPTGDFVTTRPMEIEIALIRDTTVTPAIEYPLEILNDQQWSSIRIKEVQSTLPLYLYYEKSYPNISINIYPKPSATKSLVFYSTKPLTTISTLDTVLSLPPGYERALVYNGSLELAPEYGREVSQLVLSSAIDSKASIKRTNHRPIYLKVDEALIQDGGFNILTGGFR